MEAERHQEIRELLGAYALGALGAAEARQVVAHVEDCPECRGLLDELRPRDAVAVGVSDAAGHDLLRAALAS